MRTVKEHYDMIEESRSIVAARRARRNMTTIASKPLVLRVQKDKNLKTKTRNTRRVAG